MLSLDTYNSAIQLNKIEKENNQEIIIDKYKYDYCVYKINEILIHNLGEKNEEMKKLLEQLQKNLKLKKDCNEKEKKQIDSMKIKNKNLNNEEIKTIKIKNPNIFKELENTMKNIDKDIKKTAKEFIKLILRDSPYPGYNNDINVDDIFNKSNDEIKKFILKLKIKYNPDKYEADNINQNKQKENHKISTLICSHLNNILINMDN